MPKKAAKLQGDDGQAAALDQRHNMPISVRPWHLLALVLRESHRDT